MDDREDKKKGINNLDCRIGASIDKYVEIFFVRYKLCTELEVQKLPTENMRDYAMTFPTSQNRTLPYYELYSPSRDSSLNNEVCFEIKEYSLFIYNKYNTYQ